MHALHVQHALQQKSGVSDCNKMHFNCAVYSCYYAGHFYRIIECFGLEETLKIM